MIEFPPLLAALEDIIPVVIFIIIAIISVIGNILNKAGQKQKPGGRGPRAGGQPQQGKKPAAEQLVDEIGDFLRKAAKQGGEQKPGGRQRRPEAAVERRRPVRAEAVEAQVISETPSGAGVERHVREHLKKEKLSQKASRLGSGVAQADKKAEQRVHESLDREVSVLAKRSKKEKKHAEMPQTAAAGFAALFANSENVRQAIIINEILTRPVDRWE